MLTYHTRRRRIVGQGMTEYIIVVALIAVAAIGVYSAFGDVVRGQTSVDAVALSITDSTPRVSTVARDLQVYRYRERRSASARVTLAKMIEVGRLRHDRRGEPSRMQTKLSVGRTGRR
jgi:Flp pilus assembly pilin Flp